MINAKSGAVKLEGTCAELISDLFTVVISMKHAFRDANLENPKAEIKKIVLEALDDELEAQMREEAKKDSIETKLEELIKALRGE